MRHAIPLAAVTLALTVSAGSFSRPAHAERANATSQQQIMLARNDNDVGPNMFALLQDIQRLQEQVRDLRGEIDTLKYQLRQNEQGQRDLYENLDKRLSALEGGGSAASSGGAAASGSASVGAASSSGSGAASGGDYGAPAGSQQTQQTQAPAQNEDPAVKTAYMKAFNELKNGKYDAAISGFKGFLDQHPETSYSDNAWYWLGEANYVRRNYDASLQAFQTVVNRFKASDKVPGSLYKIGVIQAEQGQTDNAKATLNRVIDQYPDDNAAEMARKRLQSIG